MFGGKFRSPVRRPIKPDLDRTEDWRSLYLYIQVCSLLVLVSFARMSPCLTSRPFPQPGSIRTSQDILALISQSQSVQVSASSSGGASQQALIEDLPPVLILHIGRVAASSEMKMGKSIQSEPELKIPLGTISSSLSVTEAEYIS